MLTDSVEMVDTILKTPISHLCTKNITPNCEAIMQIFNNTMFSYIIESHRCTLK